MNDLFLKIKDSESIGKLPDYFIFFDALSSNETPEKSKERKMFFTNYITPLFVMGPVFYTQSLRTAHAICMPCKNDNQSVKFNPEMAKISEIWRSIYADLQGAYTY